MEDQVFISYKFSFSEPGFPHYEDALVLLLEEYQSLTKDQIEQMKLERYENWKRSLQAQSSDVIEES